MKILFAFWGLGIEEGRKKEKVNFIPNFTEQDKARSHLFFHFETSDHKSTIIHHNKWHRVGGYFLVGKRYESWTADTKHGDPELHL